MKTDEALTVCTVNNPYEANVIKTALQGKGVLCQLDDQGQAGQSDPVEIGILVWAWDADLARRIIRHKLQNHRPRSGRRGQGT